MFNVSMGLNKLVILYACIVTVAGGRTMEYYLPQIVGSKHVDDQQCAVKRTRGVKAMCLLFALLLTLAVAIGRTLEVRLPSLRSMAETSEATLVKCARRIRCARYLLALPTLGRGGALGCCHRSRRVELQLLATFVVGSKGTQANGTSGSIRGDIRPIYTGA